MLEYPCGCLLRADESVCCLHGGTNPVRVAYAKPFEQQTALEAAGCLLRSIYEYGDGVSPECLRETLRKVENEIRRIAGEE